MKLLKECISISPFRKQKGHFYQAGVFNSFFYSINWFLMFFLGAKITCSSKVITLKLSLDLKKTSVVNFKIAKTSSVDNNYRQKNEKKS